MFNCFDLVFTILFIFNNSSFNLVISLFNFTLSSINISFVDSNWLIFSFWILIKFSYSIIFLNENPVKIECGFFSFFWLELLLSNLFFIISFSYFISIDVFVFNLSFLISLSTIIILLLLLLFLFVVIFILL